jgi:hypothetical protein
VIKEKVFPLKFSLDGNGALKESVNKHSSDEQTRIKVVFALDSDLRIVEPHLFNDGVFIDSVALTSQNNVNIQDFLSECKRDSTPIFFALGSLTYICVHNIVMTKGNIVKNTINLYVPNSIKKSGLICHDVSTVFPRQNRNVLANNFLNYSMSRL